MREHPLFADWCADVLGYVGEDCHCVKKDRPRISDKIEGALHDGFAGSILHRSVLVVKPLIDTGNLAMEFMGNFIDGLGATVNVLGLWLIRMHLSFPFWEPKPPLFAYSCIASAVCFSQSGVPFAV